MRNFYKASKTISAYTESTDTVQTFRPSKKYPSRDSVPFKVPKWEIFTVLDLSLFLHH